MDDHESEELRRLNTEVTAAIFRAEHLPNRNNEALEAFREVSRIEAEIVKRTNPHDLDGITARLGAVTASVSGYDHETAWKHLFAHLFELGYRKEVLLEMMRHCSTIEDLKGLLEFA